MPQLGDDLAQKTASAVSNTGLIDDGVYLVRLDGPVEVKDGASAPQWLWPFVIEEGQPFAGRKITHRTSLAEGALWRLNDTFAGFGVPTSTDTDELTGRKVRLNIVQKDNYKQEIDDETGLVKLVNDVKTVLPEAGPTGVNEAVKLRREAARKAAIEEQAEKLKSGAASTSTDGLF